MNKIIRTAAFYHNDQSVGIGVDFTDELANVVYNEAVKAVQTYKGRVSVYDLLVQLNTMAEHKAANGVLGGIADVVDDRILAVTAYINIFVLEAWGVIKADEYNGAVVAVEGK